MVIAPWAFICLVALAGACGAGLAARFDGVALAPDRYFIAMALPSVLALIFSGSGVALPVALWTSALVAVLSCLGVIDATTRTVPDILSVPMIALGILHASISGFDAWVFGGFAMAVVGLGLLGQLLLPSQSWIGGGDVLLIAGAVAWFGPALLPDIVLLCAAVLCLGIAAGSLATPRAVTCSPGAVPRDTGVPLAPALGAAQLAVWFGGPLF